MVLKLGHYGNQIRNTWKFGKCGFGEGWRRSVRPTAEEMKECNRELLRIGIAYTQQRKKGQLDWSHAGKNCLLEYVIEEKNRRKDNFFHR